MKRRMGNWRAGPSVLGILVLTGAVGLGVMGISTSVSGAASAKKITGIPNYRNTLAGNTKGWCPITVPANLPCDGAPGDYGTIHVLKSSFTNYGGYASAVPGPNGVKKYARVSGGQDGGVPTVNGCSVPGNEDCSGPYTKFGSTVHHAIFPAGGFTTSIQLYIDASWAGAHPGNVVDWDVALRDNTGAFLEDNAFNLCSTSAGGGGFYVSTSFGAGGCSTGPTELSVSGWYTFNLTFTSAGGQVVDTYSVLNSAASPVFSDTVPTGNATTGVGGPDYGWLPDEDVLGLPVSHVSLSLL
jgi:hypothetical protein